MLTRRVLGTAVVAVTLVAASGAAHAAAERSLMGIVLGRSYRQVLTKFGTPSQVQVVVIPVPGQGTAGAPDANAPGGTPGYGGPGGGPGGAPGYGGPPGGSSGPPGAGGVPGYGGPGMSSGGGPGGSGGPSYGPPGGSGGPPALPPVGGAPGVPGYGGGGDNTAPGGAPITGVGNGAEWIYHRPGGVTMAFIINEDGRVAQISVSSEKPYAAAHTAKGIGLGADYKRVLMAYGWPQRELIGGYFVESYYTKNYHASFTFVKGKLVRITIALAD